MKKIISLIIVLVMFTLVGCQTPSIKGRVFTYIDEENITHVYTEISETKMKDEKNNEYLFSITVEEGKEILTLYLSGVSIPAEKFVIGENSSLTVFTPEQTHQHNFINGICDCGEEDPNYTKEKDVDILCLSASSVEEETQQPQRISMRRLSARSNNEDTHTDEFKCDHEFVNGVCIKCGTPEFPTGKTDSMILCGFGGHKDYDKDGDGISDYAQYVVMYKSEKHINFTISLVNPKGYSIDAVQLTCDDPNAKIKVFNSDGTFTWELLSQAPDGYVINWASENAYRKTYYLETTAPEAVNTLKVVDLKVNGEWQNQALDNDELKIYKMDDSDLYWEFVTNTLEAYKWRFIKSENITNLKVAVDGEEVVADENGIYSVGKDCVVEFEYEYTKNGVAAKWNDSRAIELLGLLQYSYNMEIISTGDNNYSALFFYFNKGSDIKFEKIKIQINDVFYEFEVYIRNDGNHFYTKNSYIEEIFDIKIIEIEKYKENLENIYIVIGEENISFYNIVKYLYN